MKKIKELTYTDLNCGLKEDILTFKNTNEIEPFNGIIGQERAVEAIKTSMQIEKKGFNLYISGSVGIGKTSFALSVVNTISKNKTVPNDFCYVNNFENANEPIAIELPAGMGFEFKQDMSTFVKSLLTRLCKTLAGDIYEKEKNGIAKRFEDSKDKIMKEFDKSTFEQGFKVRNTKEGIFFSPVFNGNVIDEKEFNNLDKKTRNDFHEKTPVIQAQTMEILKQLDDIDKKLAKTIEEWESNITTFAVTQCMSELKIKYKKNLKIQNFLYCVQSDVVKNISAFKDNNQNSQSQIVTPTPFGPQAKRDNKPWENYFVNLLVNNDKLYHAPVVLCKNPNYFDLFGKLEFETGIAGVKTNYKMLKPGLIHKANGGYLILNVRDLLASAPTWEAFKRVLKNQELTIDSSRDIAQPITVVTLKPEAIPAHLQVILIGSEQNYQQLLALDPDFKKLFKIKADFDDTYEKNPHNIYKLAQYISFLCKKYTLLPFSKNAVEEIVKYSSKCANNKNKLTAIMQYISDIAIEASYLAEVSNKKTVTAENVKGAYNKKQYRFSKYDDNLNEMISDGDIMISTGGTQIGQINGLTIVMTGDCAFGHPVRITANTFMGKAGVVNIEREVSLSGTSHSKGVYILAAYIGEKYAQETPLSLTASICFEQLYNGVDGDSASSTELYAILSSLSSLPINQNLAVTGSVNQKGEIQPIGGVTDKIEGFFRVCKSKGVNKENGVLIPYQNVKNLNLSDEIVEAVKNGTFHIYPISTIDEGIELLTGKKAGEINEDGTFEPDSVNYLVANKLSKYAHSSIKFN